MPVSWEGPATYRTSIGPNTQYPIPNASLWLVFHGVSYACVVRIDGVEVGRHEGMWDAFSVPIVTPNAEHPTLLEVEVIKSGGPTHPVKDVASGFLPFVFHTFGGIYQPVELLVSESDPLSNLAEARPTRVTVEGSRMLVNGQPFYVRAPLTWGWYPEVGHTNPPEATIRREIRRAKELGFNTIKFCLWVPPHRYLEIMREEGMEAWLELPLWDPSSDIRRQARMFAEIVRIVQQYRRHENIIIWTAGCELSESTSPEFRRSLFEMIKRETGCPLVKDNSGGAEMYGGDLREFGDFYDFHPYSDTPFYPLVLDSLLPGPRSNMPMLLGEFNDVDVVRDLPRLRKEGPYWASPDSHLNAQGVRWQHDLPSLLDSENPLSPMNGGERGQGVRGSSRDKALFMRKYVQEAVRARGEIGGYVVTGWRDTPISTSGIIDDWGEPRFGADEIASWNRETCLFIIPSRRPPWIRGGNRPGWSDAYNHFVGQVFWRIGLHSERGVSGRGSWSVARGGQTISQGEFGPIEVGPLDSREIGQVHWIADEPGDYRLSVSFGEATNEWPIWIVPKRGFTQFGLGPLDQSFKTQGLGEQMHFLDAEGTIPMPFWREAAYEFAELNGFWTRVPFANRWERLLAVSPDCALDIEHLTAKLDLSAIEVLMNRIDTRTYKDHPIMIRAQCKGARIIATTLRPFGGLGIQPAGLECNPAGSELLWCLLHELKPR